MRPNRRNTRFDVSFLHHCTTRPSRHQETTASGNPQLSTSTPRLRRLRYASFAELVQPRHTSFIQGIGEHVGHVLVTRLVFQTQVSLLHALLYPQVSSLAVPKATQASARAHRQSTRRIGSNDQCNTRVDFCKHGPRAQDNGCAFDNAIILTLATTN